MPIKFRCQHCRQFLGISRSKAGSVVDCPTCGRSVRVPNLDGSVEPIPAPKLDLNDSGLASALDQLASIGDIPPEEEEEESAEQREWMVLNSASAKFLEKEEASQAAKKAEPKELPPAPVAAPIEVALPQPVAPAASPRTTSLSDSDTLGALAAGLPAARPIPGVPPPSLIDMLLMGPVMATLVGVAVLFFALGLVIAKLGGSETSSAESPSVASSAAGGSATAVAEETAGKPAAVRGRITYVDSSGDRREDAGASVIVLPSRRKGTAKLPVAGFRPTDEEADFSVAAAAVRALGGEVAKVGTDGRFEIALPEPGTYRVLVLSKHHERDADGQVSPELRSLIESYFDRPDQLLGRFAHHNGEVPYNGERTQPWDHAFGRE